MACVCVCTERSYTESTYPPQDWTNMMRGISGWHRLKARVLGAVGLGGKAGAVLPKEAMDKIRCVLVFVLLLF